MGKFFKTIGKGILYVFGLPILVVFLAIYLVISIFGFIFTGFKALILFFKGESITGKLKEDIIAEERLNALANPMGTFLDKMNEIQQNQIKIQQQILESKAANNVAQIENKKPEIIENMIDIQPEEEISEFVNEPAELPDDLPGMDKEENND